MGETDKLSEVEMLVVDARHLVSSIATTDSRLDDMLKKATLVSNRLTCAKEYQRGVEGLLVATNKFDRRKALLNELQRENRMIKSYEEENSMLRDQLEKSYATLDEILARHRSIMQRVHSEAPFSQLTPTVLDNILKTPFVCEVATRTDQIEKARRLMDVMRYCEVVAQRESELLARLVKENRSLRELLNYASMSDPNIIAHFRMAMLEYDKEQRRQLQRRPTDEDDDVRVLEMTTEGGGAVDEQGDGADEEDEEDEQPSIMNKTDGSTASTCLNSTIRFVTPSRRAFRKGDASDAEAVANTAATVVTGACATATASILHGLHEADAKKKTVNGLSILADLEEPLDAQDTVADASERSPRKECGASDLEVSASDAEVSASDADADSGTASSLSSSPSSASPTSSSSCSPTSMSASPINTTSTTVTDGTVATVAGLEEATTVDAKENVAQ